MKRVQFGEKPLLHQFGMQRRHAVDPMRHDEGKFTHLHLVVLHDADVMRTLRMGGEVVGVDASR